MSASGHLAPSAALFTTSLNSLNGERHLQILIARLFIIHNAIYLTVNKYTISESLLQAKRTRQLSWRLLLCCVRGLCLIIFSVMRVCQTCCSRRERSVLTSMWFDCVSANVIHLYKQFV